MALSRFTRWIANPGWLLILPVLVLIPGMTGFPYPVLPGAYSDIAVTHYPNALVIIESLLRYHEFPLWSPLILGGYPFAANPLSGLWYPPGWLALLLPLPLGFNITLGLHVLLGGAGMYFLLRRMGLGAAPTLAGALGFGFMPKLFAHFGAGHLTLIYAVCWTPWLAAAQRLAAQRDGVATSTGQRRTGAFPALVFGLIVLADVRWSIPALLLWGLLVVEDMIRVVSTPGGRWNPILPVRRMLGQVLLGALLAGAMLLPLVEYTRLSTRIAMDHGDTLSFSLPPGQLLNLLLPLSRSHEWVVYPGAAMLLLGVAGVFIQPVRQKTRGWAAAGGISLLLSISASLPLFRDLTGWLGLGLLRAPSRFMFVFGMAISVLAAHTLEFLLNPGGAHNIKPARLVVTAGMSFTWMMAAGITAATGAVNAGLIRGCVFAGLGGLIFFLLSRRGAPAGWLVPTLLGVIILDLGVYDLGLFQYRLRADVLAENRNLAVSLAMTGGKFRVYSPSYSLPQQTAAAAGLELADGVDPLQLEKYAAFFHRAAGIPRAGYSVTLPPFAAGDPATANTGYVPDLGLLGMLNVRFVVSAFDITHPDLTPVEQTGGVRVYENRRFLPRVWMEDDPSPVVMTEWKPGRISLQADGPGVVVLSEVNYPGWQVDVDGKPQPVLEVRELLRAVEVGPGSHTIVFEFRPPSVLAGLALSGLGVFFILMQSMPVSRKDQR